MHGLIDWFARNGVVANLLMFVILVGGMMSLPEVKKEVFPEISIDMVSVTVPYRGAAPEEVEEGVCIRIEEAVQDLEGIKKITATAAENVGTVIVEVEPGYDTREILGDIKSRVDAIDTFPIETEKPVIREMTNRLQVINVSISGDADELTLKRLGERVRDELLLIPTITQVELASARPYEISIEVSEEALRRWGITFDYVANAVRRWSLDLPGGSIKTSSGEILLRTKGQAYIGTEFEQLTLLTRPDGSRLVLSDVGRVVDGFEETDKWSRLDGKPTVLVQIYRVGDQNAIEVADAVHAYVNDTRPGLPDGISITTWADGSRLLKGRLNLLIKNAISGLILVFIVLMLFLRLRLAFWVTLGIPISFLGAIAMMPILDVSISMISLFSFILVLGIVVDDAIVVGEAVFERQKRTKTGLAAAIAGSKSVSVPVIFGVLTTVAAFSPMLFVPGATGKIWRVIPLIVIPTLLFSLVESKLILPYHISHYHPPKTGRRAWPIRVWNGFFDFFGNGLEWFIEAVYRPLLGFALEWRYLTVALAVATLMLTAGLVQGGRVQFVFFPVVESDNVASDLTLPQETPAALTAEAIRRIEAAALQLGRDLEEEQGKPIFQHVLTSVGEQPFKVNSQRFAGDQTASSSQPNVGEVNVELVPSEEREVTANEIATRWRDAVGAVPGAVELTFTSNLLSTGKPIDIQLASADIEALQAAAASLKEKLGLYPGVIDITDSFRGGKPEVKLGLTRRGEALGLSLQDLGRQVRQGFFGEEAQRIQRGRDDIRVMVRYPRSERESMGNLEGMRVRTPGGGEAPFSTVATAGLGRGFSTIRRVDRQRTIQVVAEVDESVANANEVIADLKAGFLPELSERYRGVGYSFEGAQQSQQESFDALLTGMIVALFAIYAMMAIPFRSYIQPAIVMSAVPFGIVGAVWGHAFFGLAMSMLSMCGVVALTGIVVNDSLVLVSFINSHRGRGVPLADAVRDAGVRRFRPILLTSLTTAAGITPLMLERSVQAQFLIPMAVALAFGVLFATFITLGLVPALYMILDDFYRGFRWIYTGSAEPQATTEKGEEALLTLPIVPEEDWGEAEQMGAD